MKKLAVFLLTAFIIAVALAQSAPVEIEKKVVCDDTKKIMNTLMTEYQESPVWGGQDENTNFGLLINQETGTWTIVQFNKATACILGVGDNSRAMSFGKSKNTL
jgi:hypothetical protein